MKAGKPSLQFNTKVKENKQFEFKCKAELNEFMQKKRVFKDNLFKAFALFWDQCAKAMQAKIMSRSDYESAMYNNPLALLKAMKERAMDFQETI
jgi:hypothetical protein